MLPRKKRSICKFRYFRSTSVRFCKTFATAVSSFEYLCGLNMPSRTASNGSRSSRANLESENVDERSTVTN